MKINEPKNKSKSVLDKLIKNAIASDDMDIGDLTERDAQYVAEKLESLGFKTDIERDSDNDGLIVDSANWKIVRFKKQTDEEEEEDEPLTTMKQKNDGVLNVRVPESDLKLLKKANVDVAELVRKALSAAASKAKTLG